MKTFKIALRGKTIFKTRKELKEELQAIAIQKGLPVLSEAALEKAVDILVYLTDDEKDIAPEFITGS